MVTMRPMEMTAEHVIRVLRNTYQSTPADDATAQETIFRVAGSVLGLDHSDYEDLIRHLITADEPNEGVIRWTCSVATASG